MRRRQLLYRQTLRDGDTETVRQLCRTDLFFLLTVILGRDDAAREWIFERCQEVQAEPDSVVDIWARGHYKSTLKTFAKIIQDILCNPEITVGIFSHTRPIAKGFLAQIKRELEQNDRLKALFPEILYAEPEKEAPRWSIDDGIIVRRKSNPKESTVEAWGLVDGQPTAKHFQLLNYDDVVTIESVNTAEQIEKTTKAWEFSLNLGTDGGRQRYTGTFYHQLDTYTMMIKRGAKARIHAATADGTVEGAPVLISQADFDEKREKMGQYVFATQMLCTPLAIGTQGFRTEWLCYYTTKGAKGNLNVYLTVDPAGSKKKKDNDFTVMIVCGLGSDGNYYLLDGVRDRMNLTERAECLFRLVQKWKPLRVGYEEYGMQADIEHIRYIQETHNYRFNITPLGGKLAKAERIAGLVPIFEGGRMWLPARLHFVGVDGQAHDWVQQFIDDEYAMYPVSAHDDMLDDLARVLDPALGAVFPAVTQHAPFRVQHGPRTTTNDEYDFLRGKPIER